MFDGLPGGEERKRRARQVAQAYRAAHEVVSAAASMGVLVFAGYWLDRRWGSSPVLTICGACLGFVIAGTSLRQLLRRLDQESAANRRNRSGDKGAPGG